MTAKVHSVLLRLFRGVLALGLALAAALTTGCAYIVDQQTSHAADQLSATILNHDDPQTVSAALPTLLILMDSYASGKHSSGEAKLSAGRLYGAYASAFVNDDERRKTLTATAFHYAREGSCKIDFAWCDINRLEPQAFAVFMESLKKPRLSMVYDYAVAWLSYIEAHSDDWNAIADLPKPQQMFELVAALEPGYDNAGAYIYLGALALTLPPALGGKPEVGRRHFERAIELTDGRNLVAKLELARRYARLVFDKALYHQMLTDVLASDPRQEGLTLMNVWAQQQAQKLLEEESEYFD